ncbi:MAG TPA: RNA polymerase sigma factor [Thermoanaerobaculia bacterium]
MADEFEAFCRRYRKALIRHVKNAFDGFTIEDAEEIAQEAFLNVSRKDTAVGWAYLAQTARNLAKNRIRDNQTLKYDHRKNTPLEDDFHPRDKAPNAEATLIQTQQAALNAQRIREAIATMSERVRQAFLLRYRGESLKTIQAKLCITEDAAKSRLSEARAHLKKTVGELPDVDWPTLANEVDDDHEK